MKYSLKFWLKIGLLTILFVVILVYSYYKTKDLFRGIKLTTIGIEDGKTVSNSLLELQGKARNAVYLSVNDREIFINTEGVFNDSLILSPGYNIITIKAQDKFGKEKEEVFRVILLDE